MSFRYQGDPGKWQHERQCCELSCCLRACRACALGEVGELELERMGIHGCELPRRCPCSRRRTLHPGRVPARVPVRFSGSAHVPVRWQWLLHGQDPVDHVPLGIILDKLHSFSMVKSTFMQQHCLGNTSKLLLKTNLPSSFSSMLHINKMYHSFSMCHMKSETFFLLTHILPASG